VAIEDAGAVITHDDMPDAFCDQAQIRQVFQNLIGNAVKFHGEDPPHVHVGVRREADVWVISVRDNGIGVEAEYFQEVFRIYRRLQSRETYPGTGMGLAICKRIIERHDQRLWVESEPGVGTTFFFTLQTAE
jgi:two-component system, chemotaxis family, sensor kinase Cph1